MGSNPSARPHFQTSEVRAQGDSTPPPYQPTPPTWNWKPHNTKSFMSLNIVQHKENPAPGDLDHFWHAELQVANANIDYLMREGFHWDERNIRKGQGFLETGNDVFHRFRTHGWTAVRYYFLTSAPGTRTDGQWTARLRVLSNEVKILSEFRVSHMTLDRITSCNAYVHGKEVYRFRKASLVNNINVYYDDMPLKGWWPWPREDEKEGPEQEKLIGNL